MIKKISLILLLIISICSCNKDISQLNTETVKWNDLPNEVQKAIIESSDSSYVNLDSKLFATEYKSTSIVGLYKGKMKFYLNNNECYYLNWNGNKEVAPFIFFNKKMYYLYAPNGGGPMFRSEDILKEYNYKIIDL